MGKVRCARFVEMGGMSRVPEPGRSQCTLGHVNESAWRWRESRTGNFALEAAEGKVKIQRVYVVEPAAARRWRGAVPCGCGILHHPKSLPHRGEKQWVLGAATGLREAVVMPTLKFKFKRRARKCGAD